MYLLLQAGANVQEKPEETVNLETDKSVVEDEDQILNGEKSTSLYCY